MDAKEILQSVTDRAGELGSVAGRAAGSWVIDGNTSEATARRILAGIEDGDLEVLDALPSSPFYGTRQMLARELNIEEDEDELRDAACDAYAQGFSDACEAEVARAARYIVDAGE